MKRKNPFKGIACSNGSSYGLKFFRHIEGARDWRRSWLARNYSSNDGTFRDANPVPVLFTE